MIETILALAAATFTQAEPTGRFMICPGHPRCSRASIDSTPGGRELEIVNDSGRVITNVTGAPPDQDHWGEDLLGPEVLKEGNRASVALDPSSATCLWEFQVTFDDGTTSRQNIDVCKAEGFVVTAPSEGEK